MLGWLGSTVKNVAQNFNTPFSAATGAAASALGVNDTGKGLVKNMSLFGPGMGVAISGSGINMPQAAQPVANGGMVGTGADARNADMNAGYAKGKEIFYDDPDMQMLRDKRMDLAKGYNGQELGAMRSQARNEIQGQRSSYLRNMSGNLAKGGVGGARAAAMKAGADQGFQKNGAEMERKMTLDNANLVRSGTNDMQDFLMRQKYGMLGTGLGYAELGVSDRTAAANAAAAGREREKGPLGQLWENTVGGLF